MQNYHQSGDVLDLAPTVAVANGAGNLFGPALFGVAQQAVAANTVGAFRIRGVVTLAKTAGLAIPIGSRVFWDATNKVVNLTAKKRNGERYATSKAEAMNFFERYFGYVAKSDFLTGRDGRWSGCDLAWLVKADNFAKVLQGNYENRQQEATT